MERNERLNDAVKHLKFMGIIKTQKDIAKKMCTTPPNVSSALSGVENVLTDNFLKRFNEAFNHTFNMTWLLTGEGEMLNTTNEQEDGTLIPLLPISAQGGSLNDFIVSVKGSECEKVLSPVRGADFAIPVAGDSMAPEYPNGSQVHIKKINEHAFIEWGKVYVLDTCNGVVIKRVVPSEREGYIRCLSINTNPIYAPFDVAMTDIYGIYRVMLCLSIK
jgi:hypothetical protein